MGRAPCCDKVGLKKGPWTPEEDQILFSFIQHHGHSNWRALPKQAGLLRCGKSCRLRWINYLRPDIKRGNFSREEEETIIQLHEMMGNRWSAIAARLPGRTDNEIKNVWHTHLKKTLKEYQPTKSHTKTRVKKVTSSTTTTDESTSSSENNFSENGDHSASSSPQQSYTTSEDISSVSDALSVELSNNSDAMEFCDTSIEEMTSLEYLPIIDETFWESQELQLDDNYNMSSEFSNVIMEDNHQFDSSLLKEENFATLFHSENNGTEIYGDDDDMDFWLNVFVQAGGAS